jgi:hypothetical protein
MVLPAMGSLPCSQVREGSLTTRGRSLRRPTLTRQGELHPSPAPSGCALAAGQPPAAAGWQLVGPYGGSVARFDRYVASPAVIYATIFSGGVYRSRDGGATWANASGNLPAEELFDLAADPADPDSAWVISPTDPGPSLLYHTADAARRGGLRRSGVRLCRRRRLRAAQLRRGKDLDRDSRGQLPRRSRRGPVGPTLGLRSPDRVRRVAIAAVAQSPLKRMDP